MTRKEEREEAARIRANQYSHPAEWNDCYKHWIEGAEWSDANPDGMMLLHVLNKSAEQAKKLLIEKTCEFLKSYRQDTPDGAGYIAGIVNDKTIEDYKEYIKEV